MRPGRDRLLTRFWAALTTSMFGSAVTMVAVPIIAVRDLDASPAQMGLLVAASLVPSLLLRLPAAAWADATTTPSGVVIGRALLINGALVASVPGLWWFGALTLPVLTAVVAMIGAVAMVVEGFAGPMLPRLVSPERLPAANGRFQVSRNAADVSGPGIAGVLFQVVSAPVVLLLDAVSYVVAGLLIHSLPHDSPADRPTRRTSAADVMAGFGAIFVDRFLRRCLTVVACVSLANGMAQALLVILMVDTIGLSAATVGAVLAAGAVGGIVAGAVVGRVRAALGLAGTVVAGTCLLVSSFALLPLAGPGWIGPAAVVHYELAGSFGATLLVVTVFSEIPARVAENRIARGLAVANLVPDASALIGALIGGSLAVAVGIRPTLIACVAIAAAGATLVGGHVLIRQSTAAREVTR